MCSTFKPLAAADLIRRGRDLDHLVRYGAHDLVEWSPITGERGAMTYGELCDAAIRFSDNTAGNLVLRGIGGPRGLTGELRRLGDRVSRLDRWETELNSAIPGDERGTTTPRALATTYTHLLAGEGLRNRERWALRGWSLGGTDSWESVDRLDAATPQLDWVSQVRLSG